MTPTSYLYNDYALLSPLSFVVSLLDIIVLLIISWKILFVVSKKAVYIGQNYSGIVRAYLYFEVFDYFIKSEWWKFLLLWIADYSFLYILDSTVKPIADLACFPAFLSYFVLILACILNEKIDSVIEGANSFFQIGRRNRYRNFRLRKLRDPGLNSIYNSVGKDGTVAEKVINELYQQTRANKDDFLSNMPSNENTVPFVLVFSTTLIMLFLVTIFVIGAYGHGKDYARVKNEYYITSDKSHVALPISSNKYELYMKNHYSA